jgi:hypothetical protein
VDIKHTIMITVEFENIMRGSIPDPLKFSSNIVVASVNRRECLGMLDICPHLVPVLPYENVTGGANAEEWIPEYAPEGGRRRDVFVDPIRDPPEYIALFEGESEEEAESDEDKSASE